MLKIYNTLTKTKQGLPHIPTRKTPLRLFVCGPTVYDEAHIGHARTYAFFDSFVKYLRIHHNYPVYYVQNITDIDDKIINRAKEKNIPTTELSQMYEHRYKESMARLSIDSVDTYANATAFIPAIIEQIQILIQKKYAYEKNGSVYYRVHTFKPYGTLSGQSTTHLQNAERDANTHKGEKEDPNDFVVWKASKDDEPQWDSPFGKGRPGWHIEDTAIAYSLFKSPQYELHGGAQDLIFPHHEAEIALMESAYDKTPFVHRWMHTGFLNVNGEKMSKSLGNFITIHDVLDAHSPHTVRTFFALRHYRSPMDYTEQALRDARATSARIQELYERVQKTEKTEQTASPQEHSLIQHIQLFWGALEDDFNTPKSFSELFTLITHTNTFLDHNHLSEATARQILSFFQEINNIFTLFSESHDIIPQEIHDMARKRQEHKRKKEWEQADTIRNAIHDKGYDIADIDDNEFKIKKRTD